MSWEKRGPGLRYYYAAVKRGGRVQKIYMGKGAVGEMTAAADSQARTQRQARRTREAAHRRRYAATLEPLDRFDRLVTQLVDASLLIAGFRPRGCMWARRRLWRKNS